MLNVQFDEKQYLFINIISSDTFIFFAASWTVPLSRWQPWDQILPINVMKEARSQITVRLYKCQDCGKQYRWKSTLNRHRLVECGGKEPLHQCPWCSYRAKQRGNLAVHIRKHHPEKMTK